jgi:hypothetical protein
MYEEMESHLFLTFRFADVESLQGYIVTSAIIPMPTPSPPWAFRRRPAQRGYGVTCQAAPTPN